MPSWLCCVRSDSTSMPGIRQEDRDRVQEIPYTGQGMASAPPMPSSSSCSDQDLPGPLGCRYDDSLTHLEIQLVCPGIREKKIMKASNTDVHLKYDTKSLNCTVEICDVDKKSKTKTVVDRRYFEVAQFPGDVQDVSYRLKKDCVVLNVKKKLPFNAVFRMLLRVYWLFT